MSIGQVLNGWRDLWRRQLADKRADCGHSLQHGIQWRGAIKAAIEVKQNLISCDTPSSIFFVHIKQVLQIVDIDLAEFDLVI